MSESKVIYDKNTLEFVTVALEYCALVENTSTYTLFTFVDKAIKIMPLLYLKATLLPYLYEPEDTDYQDCFITEETYEVIRLRIAELMGKEDSFLDTFQTDMKFSDTPIAATISENMADIYQDLGNFAALFRRENEDVMTEALYFCEVNFRLYWGQKLLNVMKALHSIRYNDDFNNEEE
ncbi:MAG: DUF5063 domain-containing protein [Tannerella sp.]|jgi:hypothetical protein|nr:DUF5063 domain-containing protein [Tannerella sp.]